MLLPVCELLDRGVVSSSSLFEREGSRWPDTERDTFRHRIWERARHASVGHPIVIHEPGQESVVELRQPGISRVEYSNFAGAIPDVR